MSLPPRVAEQGCDVCHVVPATRWFGDTSGILCDNQKCYDDSQRTFNEGIDELRSMENY